VKLFIIAALLLLLNTAAQAADAGISASNVWMRASLGKVPTTAAYFTLENRGATEDRLLSVSTPVSAMAHIHNSVTTDAGVVQMAAVMSLSIKPGEKVELKPGGMHVMVMNLKAPLKAGETVLLTLWFQKAGEITVEAQVRGLDGAPLKH
jgi:periplasmic copper chaperone A